MSPTKDKQKSAKRTTAANKKSNGFTDEERAAVKERAQELKAEARRGRGRKGKADGERDVLAKIAEMKGSDRAMAKRLHAIIKETAPELASRLVRDARVCQGRQGRLLLHRCVQVQREVRDVRLQRLGEPRRRQHVADLLRAEGADPRRGEEDRRAREEGGELRHLPRQLRATDAGEADDDLRSSPFAT
jgi:hypothetical protein